MCFSTTNEHLSFKNVLMKRTTTQFGITSNTGHVCLVNSDISLLYAKKTDLVTSPKYNVIHLFVFIMFSYKLGGLLKRSIVSVFPPIKQKEKHAASFIIREVPIRAQQVVIKIQNNCFILTRNFMSPFFLIHMVK